MPRAALPLSLSRTRLSLTRISLTQVTLSTLATLACTAAFAAEPGQAGRWVTESGNLEIEIAPCEDALCGTVVKVLGNRSMSMPGQPLVPADGQSPLGRQILAALRPADNGELDGRIYNREDGKTYGVRLALLGEQQLQVRPYLTPTQFGPTQLWRRPTAAAAPTPAPASAPATTPAATPAPAPSR